MVIDGSAIDPNVCNRGLPTGCGETVRPCKKSPRTPYQSGLPKQETNGYPHPHQTESSVFANEKEMTLCGLNPSSLRSSGYPDKATVHTMRKGGRKPVISHEGNEDDVVDESDRELAMSGYAPKFLHAAKTASPEHARMMGSDGEADELDSPLRLQPRQ